MNKTLNLTLCLLMAVVANDVVADDTPVKITDAKLHSVNYGIESLQHWISKAKPGDKRRAEGLTRDHEKLSARFSRIPASDTDQYKYVADRLKQLRSAIRKLTGNAENTQVKFAAEVAGTETATTRPHPDVINISRSLSAIQRDIPRYNDNARQRVRMRNDVETLKQRFHRIPKSKQADYLAVQKQLAAVETALQPKGGPLNMNDSEVSEYLAAIQKKYGEELLLPEPRDIMKNRELTAEDVDDIVAKMKAFGENADKDLPKLRRVVEATGQGNYWLEWLQSESIAKLKRNMESIKSVIDRRIDAGLRDAKNRSELDPEKNRYAFSNESVRKQHEADHARTLRTIQQAIRLEKLLGVPATTSPKLNELNDYLATYKAKAGAASIVRELPAEVGTKEQHAIAREVFGNEKYGVGKTVHVIVNSKTVPRDRIEHKAFSGRLETVVRKWEQFQVTTVEDEGGKLFVYVNDLARFSRAPETTPIGTWIMTQRFKRGEIQRGDISAAVAPSHE